MAAIAVFAGAFSGASDRNDIPVKGTICEVLHDPSYFDGKLIRVTARMSSVGMEWLTLSSDDCGGFGMGVRTPNSFPGMKAMNHARLAGGIAREDKEIIGIFTGRFELSKDEPAERILNITRVRILSVKLGTPGPGKLTQ
jgi:hypothetical protein